MRRALVSSLAISLAAFTGATTAQTVERGVAVVSDAAASQIPAFSYVEGPEFELVFRGSSLVPAAAGAAEVEFQNGRARIAAGVRDLPDPAKLGPYATYVLWAVTPEGLANNLGALEVRSGRAELNAAAPLAQFALIVTAEPHFAVTVPSTAVVLQNFTRDARLRQSMVRTLNERADYARLAAQPKDPRGRTPLDLVQARYALAIAQAVSAATYAPDAFGRAEGLIKKAEAAQISKKSAERRQTALFARDAVQSLEAARRDAVTARAASDQKARETSQAAAAEAEAQRRTAAIAEEARLREATLVEQNRIAAQKAAAEQKDREMAQAAAAEAEAQTRAAAAAADAAAGAAAKARADLTERLNKALPTRETERGLVAQLSGVQFATGGAKLNVAAQTSLARFGGILLSYPEIRFMVEGHTDNVGAEAANAALSLQRAITVRDFLIAQGLAASSIDVKGLGSTAPVADNGTAAGRAGNRRVDIVMSGGLLQK
jgi:outer membrane protein OmpA-like peptidoglycan-associated protein